MKAKIFLALVLLIIAVFVVLSQPYFVCQTQYRKALSYEISRVSASKYANQTAASMFVHALVQELNNSSYKTPKIYVSGYVESPCDTGDLIIYDNMTRSGPFYHVFYVRGGCSKMQKHRNYNMTLYILGKRFYPFPSRYVRIWDYS